MLRATSDEPEMAGSTTEVWFYDLVYRDYCPPYINLPYHVSRTKGQLGSWSLLDWPRQLSEKLIPHVQMLGVVEFQEVPRMFV